MSRKSRSAHVARLSLSRLLIHHPHRPTCLVSVPLNSPSHPPFPMPVSITVCPCPATSRTVLVAPRRCHDRPAPTARRFRSLIHRPPPLPVVSFYCLHVTTHVPVSVPGLSHTLALWSAIYTRCISTCASQPIHLHVTPTYPMTMGCESHATTLWMTRKNSARCSNDDTTHHHFATIPRGSPTPIYLGLHAPSPRILVLRIASRHHLYRAMLVMVPSASMVVVSSARYCPHTDSEWLTCR